MNRRKQYAEAYDYIKNNKLNNLIDFQENMNYQKNVFDSVSGNLTIPIPPEPNDLVRLHKLIRKRKPFTVLEFGVGYSSIIMADALYKNQQEWEKLTDRPSIRNRFMFQLFSVDTSRKWIENTEKKIPKYLSDKITIQQSDVEIGKFNGRLCHYYTNIPDIVPDFIYLDGPSPKDVKGNINGLSFNCDERTVMAADLLLMESTFLPGTFIIVDGRTNNARFLEKNLLRNYETFWSQEEDFSTFELLEERLGKHNLLGSDYY